MNGTGLPFDSLAAVERSDDGRTNPMVNSGAIATTSLLPGASVEDKWQFLCDGLSRFAGRTLSLADDVYRSASETNMRNRSIAFLLRARDRIYCDPLEALDLYTRQSCLSVSASDLAVMGATLADGGVNPVTGERVIAASTCRHTLAVMTTAGLYETSGNWLYEVGLPAKSGIGGGIVAVSPGKGGLGNVRAASRRRGQQRQGSARGEISLASPRAAHPRIRAARRGLVLPDGERATRSGHEKGGVQDRIPTSGGALIVAGVAALWIVLFLLLNRQRVTVHFVFFSTRVALFWALALAAAAGILIGLGLAHRRSRRKSRS